MRPIRLNLDDRRDDLQDLMEANPAAASSFWEKLDISWVYHECALEGVVVSPEEMQAALSLKEPYPENGKTAFLLEINRQKKAIDLAKAEATRSRIVLTMDLAKQLFEALTGGAEGKGAMTLRKEMPLHRTYFHDIAQPAKIAPELERLFAELEQESFTALPPLQQAITFHHKFMSIFPFTDLSGKVGRLMMNIVLMKAGYLPAVVHGIDRQRYYDSLRHAPRILQGVISEAIEHATDHGFKFFAAQTAAAAPRSGMRSIARA